MGGLPLNRALSSPRFIGHCFSNGQKLRVIAGPYISVEVIFEMGEANFAHVTIADSRPPIVLYAGNIGKGQSLHVFLAEAAAQFEGRARFRMVGDGGRRAVVLEGLEARAVAGNPARFIKQCVRYAEVFASLDAVGMASAFGRLLDDPQFVDRADFRERFSHGRIMHDMAMDVRRPAEPNTVGSR